MHNTCDSMVVLQKQREIKQQMFIPPKDSFKFNLCQSGVARLTCCFEFQGAERLTKDDIVPDL